jgi:hypothetical protein
MKQSQLGSKTRLTHAATTIPCMSVTEKESLKTRRHIVSTGVLGIVCLVTLSCSSESSSNEYESSAYSDDAVVAENLEESVSSDVDDLVDRVCTETQSQLMTLDGGEEIVVEQCEAQPNGAGGHVFVLRLNDYINWQQISATRTTEQVMFLVPLSLVAYSFAGADVDPIDFGQIFIVFDDTDETVYEFTGDELAQVLTAQDYEDAEAALANLAKTMRITQLR